MSDDNPMFREKTHSPDDALKLWGDTVKPGTLPHQTIKPETCQFLMELNKVKLREFHIGGGEEGRENLEEDFKLSECLGQGGMGIVYRAQQTSMDREIAVKMVRPDMLGNKAIKSSFLTEAIVTGDLDHPNIVPVHELGLSSDGALFYSMKEVRGRSWCELMEELSEVENIEILLKVCDAVAYAHEKGIIHRDIKPDNVMLGDFGEVMLMDWGVAVRVDRGTGEKGMTLDQQTGHAGTPSYMAPEMAACEYGKIGTMSDVYLLGGILYEIMTGNPPHGGDNIYNCIYAAMENMIKPTDRSHELIEVARQSMSYYPEERYASVKDFQTAVRNCQVHAESIKLARLAGEDLLRAGNEGSYEDYAQALFGYREALKLWEKNPAALKGLELSTLNYAVAAYERGDLDLASSLLDPKCEGHQKILNSIAEEREARTKRRRSFKILTYSLLALIILIINVLVFTTIIIQIEQFKAVRARDSALNSEKAALSLLSKVENEKDRALKAERETKILLSAVQKAKLRTDEEKRKVEAALRQIAKSKKTQQALQQVIYDDRERFEAQNKKWHQEVLAFLSHGELISAQKILRKLDGYDPFEISSLIGDYRARYGGHLTENQILNMAFEVNNRKNGMSSDALLSKILRGKSFKQKILKRLSEIQSNSDLSEKDVKIAFKANVDEGRVEVEVDFANSQNYDRKPSINLAYLKDLPITSLDLSGLKLKNVKTLGTLPLLHLDLSSTDIIDNQLSFLEHLSLESLSLRSNPVRTLRYLKGLPLRKLDLSHTDVVSIKVLRGSSLETLDLSFTKTWDFRPIIKVPLRKLYLSGNRKIDNIMLFHNMKQLHTLVIPLSTPNLIYLQKHPTLKYIGHESLGSKSSVKPVGEFWESFHKHLPESVRR